MTTATPSTITYSQKKRLWEEFKYDTFEEISKDKATMFNYFLVNNDIFNMISPEDELSFKLVEMESENKKSRVFFGSIAAIFFIDQVVFRLAFPKFVPFKYRFTTNFFKYVIAPCICYTIYKDNFMNDEIYFFYKMQEKYSFGFDDYMKANKMFDRALAVDRLEQLREKRDEFDWTGVPEFNDPTPVK